MEKFLIGLSDKIITREELSDILDQIDQVQKNIFSKDTLPLFKQAEIFANKKLTDFFQELQNQGLAPVASEEKIAFLENLKNYLQSVPQIRIQIAKLPSNNFLKNIATWIEKETGKKMFLDIIVNPNIVGGAIIEYQGKYSNFSLEKEINKIIEQGKI